MYISRPKDLIPLRNPLFPPLLRELLSLCTPHGHESHIEKIIRGICKTVYKDKVKGNIIVPIGKSETIFSSHMDMVGSVSPGNAKIGGTDHIELMTVLPDSKKNKALEGFIWGSKVYQDKNGKYFKPSTVGADDKLGVYIMLEMIKANIPGTYMFHTGEEVGCIGSNFLHTAPEWAQLFKDNKRAIAFDRADYSDVISYQRNTRCSSTEFSKALAERLNVNMPPQQKFKYDVHGVYTDTAVYMNKIPECTNISVGYFQQHGDTECFDWYWLYDHLLPAILKTDFESLPTVRDPKKVVNTYYSHNANSNSYVKNEDRVSWADATTETGYLKFPKWEIKDGFVEAKPGVLTKAIHEYMTVNFYGEKKEGLAKYLAEVLETNELLSLEVKANYAQIKALNTKLGIIPPEPVIVKDTIIKPTDKDVKKLTTRIVDISIRRKKDFLEEFLHLGKDVTFEEAAYGIAAENYLRGAKSFLEKSVDKWQEKDYNQTSLAKMNRLIAMLAYIFSFRQDSWIKDDDEIDALVIEAYAFIIARQNEPGFRREDLDKPMKYLSNQTIKIKDAQATGHTVH